MSGLYLAEDHVHWTFRPELILSAGDELPDCPDCGARVVWEYVGGVGRRVIDKERLGATSEPSEEQPRS